MRVLVALLVLAAAADAVADESKLAKEGIEVSAREYPAAVLEECCGYPLMDFFVVEYNNFRAMLRQLAGEMWVTPHIESPRCEYLRDR